MDSIKSTLVNSIAMVEEDYSLQQFNPLKAGGTAEFFTTATTAVELASAVKAAIDAKLPYRVIGTGSTVLFSDGGYPGLIIHNRTSSYGVAADKSQVVVDAGMPLSRFITMLAGLGLGGLTAFYGTAGTVGGALYSDLTRNGSSIVSSLRYLTAVMPPSRIDKEPTINRYKREWLQREPGLTRLRSLREDRPDGDDPQPVILTAMFQLTSVRPDEIRRRIHEKSRGDEGTVPPRTAFGPIFKEVPGVPLAEMVRSVITSQLKVNGLVPDLRYPLYLKAHNPLVRSADIRELIQLVGDAVEHRYGVRPTTRYEYAGVW